MSNRNNPNWEIKSRTIFVIIFEQNKSFFLNSTTQKNLWKVYDDHYRERYAYTRKHFSECKKDEFCLPPIFILDTVEGTAADALGRCIVWSKYFVEKGYSCLAGTRMIELVDRLDLAEDAFYQSIKDISIEKMCPPEKNLFPNFKQQKAKKPGKKADREGCVRMELVFDESEYEKFKAIADELKISMTEFFLQCARHGGIYNFDMSVMDQYLKKIEDYSNTLDAIVVTILLSKDYFPPYIERMNKLSQDVIESNNEVKEELIRLCRQIRKKK